ncbi:two-component system histidine kinase PnpS [Listeria fleischmannii]|jgi:two-component system phosphate regulon sensor histidine kinase PhoR|uniref:histidine kinase n=1 Tax=Listeria fleischmannii TaxID=1069827 RepID=A0A841YE51_9LIST|nr:ATP-binding protein [Listeria fleischmannii]EIA20472.1 histidine kinase [Listeria fleischmannii subsp. coloradonensis]MBC1398510.1 cell wall metabolism sensor histidine kinase WalK [Listeria fleischmannii]MBC1418808.1 cell wall metabolism sensor histidine kinase WalK [Listeria fleischmannii]MBC1426571.1 cell wall metabolism sensor histidine kinase WalK [Listeria fleischmannii]STY46514.1 Alkaline phosphatase synthesis sensor protein phoR [Listeria fleischmannii subsp. coloradonensis]
MKKLWFKIGISFFILFFITMGLVGLFSGELMKTTYLDMKENQLEDEARVLLHTTNIENVNLDQNSAQIQEQLSPLTEEVDARITIVDNKGHVIADSKEDPTTLENHANRPEFKEVLQDGQKVGIATRKSDTLGYSMLYVAVPIVQNGDVAGALRIAVSLESVESAINTLWGNLFLIFGIALILIALISIFIARKITKPVQEIMEVSTDLANHEYSSRIYGKSSGELQELSISVNKLAESLETQMFEIRENSQRLTAIVENLVSGVMLINHDKEIVMTNRMMYRILGKQEITGKPFYEVIKSYGLSELIEETLQTKQMKQEEITIYFPKEMILDASVSPILMEDGEVSGLVLLLHDITQIRHLENVRSEFVANVSHELKTPVTALKGFAETLLDGAMYDEALLKQFLTIIKDESDRLHRLILDILALSRIEQKTLPLQIEEVNVNDMMEQSVKTVSELATLKEISIQKKWDKNKTILIENEGDRLQQILINLLSNAIQYTPAKGEISLQLEDLGDEIQLIVKDNGIGIPAKDLERIFERFYRVDKARTRHSGGTGLGLSIVKHLVDMMEGTIHVTSQENVGTTFYIRLPKHR